MSEDAIDRHKLPENGALPIAWRAVLDLDGIEKSLASSRAGDYPNWTDSVVAALVSEVKRLRSAVHGAFTEGTLVAGMNEARSRHEWLYSNARKAIGEDG